jgi:hypothetical protein
MGPGIGVGVSWGDGCADVLHYRIGMAQADASERNASSPVLRFLDELPVSPALLSFGLAALASAVLLLGELWSGRLAWLVAHDPGGLRNVRIAVAFIAMVAYLPTANLYVLRSARRTAGELRSLLRLEDADVRARVDAVGTQPAAGLRRAGGIGIFLALLIPLLVDLPRGEFSYGLDLPAEVVWHRVALPFVGWWAGRLFYVIGVESRRLSDLAQGLHSFDLFDLKPLLPFARQGLTHALFLIGLLSILMVMSLFEEGLGPIAGLFTLSTLPAAASGMLLPVRGVHGRIRAEKHRRLAWCQERLRTLQADSAGRPDGPTTRELADVLTLRSHLESVREWPFDTSTLLRFALYLLIPLGSWLGGAMVERLVDQLLG